jgi:hypothetical protein
MTEMISSGNIQELLKAKDDGYLFHRESKELEFKSNFNFAELAEYYRDFAAFANNIGGFIIFGVSNSPRKLIGLNEKAAKQFEEIDPARISGELLDIFSSEILWEQNICNVGNLRLGVFYIFMSEQKPIISKKDYGNTSEIKAGNIYYRYAGRTQRIQYSELSHIIEQRITANTTQLLSLLNKISVVGPANAAILDTQRGLIQKDDKHLLVIDENIIPKIKFIREGHFTEKEGSITLKLVGDVHPINSVEVTKTIQKRLIDQYPYSFTKLRDEIMLRLPHINQNLISQVIRENDVKNNPQYSAYNFMFKHHEEEYRTTGKIRSGTPSLYNKDAIEFISKVLE